MTRSVLLLSGQGAQKPGMGAAAADVPEVRATCAVASDVFGIDVLRLVVDAPAEEVSDARNAQAATAALSIGLGRALVAQGFAPSAVIGFSLGEASALAVTGALGIEETFALIKVRADAMAAAAAARPGAMTALLRGTAEEAAEACAACAEGDVLVPANYNCPGQTVVSGDVAAIERVEAAWEARGGRATRLATAGAFHSPLMAEAARALRAYCEGLSFSEPRIPIICNTDARPFRAAEAARRLSDHLTHPVRFEENVRACLADGAGRFVEAGFGGVLVGLVKRIDRSVERVCVAGVGDLAACAALSGADPGAGLGEETGEGGAA